MLRIEENIFHLTQKRKEELGIGDLPRSLDEALDELESDSKFLKPIFNQSILDTFVELKREEPRTCPCTRIPWRYIIISIRRNGSGSLCDYIIGTL